MQTITKEVYEKGLRCRGMCQLCNRKFGCYQYQMQHPDSPAEPFQKTYFKTVPVETTITINTNDVFNWMTECPDIKALEYLGKYALSCARSLKNAGGESPDPFD